ncbi:hypothetical protein [Tropicimonas sp. S265A]|uniref:hypothetical protein n=1 Tax=Tropicimonas sp. S265A TaxID=3415134 RepID=UPI003C7C3178
MTRKLLLAPLVLAACGPVVAFDKTGVSVSRLSSDLQTCSARALAEAPQDVQVIYTYERKFRSRGYGRAPRWEWDRERDIVDVNEGRRAVALQQCMIDAGYRVREVPRCSGTPVDIDGAYRQPSFSDQSCAVKIDGIGPVIVAPASVAG